jgi:hypothetical protein
VTIKVCLGARVKAAWLRRQQENIAAAGSDDGFVIRRPTA